MKIDFVIMWVDGSDPEWQQAKRQAMLDAGMKIKNTNDACRYRDWDNLQYWFRSVEVNAPWVNNIYFVTWGHLPKFLNTNHPKLKIVKHSDFMLPEYLPSFASPAIEVNLHRIPNLSEHFVFFNDDMFINKPVEEEDFFKNGLPCYEMIEKPFSPYKQDQLNHRILNGMTLVNRHFKRKDILTSKNIGKWLALSYGAKTDLRNLWSICWENYQHFEDNHVATPLLRSTMEEVWEEEYDIMNFTSLNHFRSADTVNDFVFRYWDLARGNFAPTHIDYMFYNIQMSNIEKCVSDIVNARYKHICINDNEKTDQIEMLQQKINAAFEKRYPNKSSFEK